MVAESFSNLLVNKFYIYFMIVLLIGILLTGLFCALTVRMLGGNMIGGFVAGVAQELILTFAPLYFVYIFPFAFVIIPIVILIFLVFFLGKLDVMKSIVAAVLTYVIAFVIGTFLLPTLSALLTAI